MGCRRGIRVSGVRARCVAVLGMALAILIAAGPASGQGTPANVNTTGLACVGAARALNDIRRDYNSAVALVPN
jgi:hypothetical protein